MGQPQWPSGTSPAAAPGFPASPVPPPGPAGGAPGPAGGAPPRGGRDPKPFLLGALGGAVVVVVIGAILIAAGAAHLGAGSSSSGVGKAPIAFPAKLAGLEDVGTVATSLGGQDRGGFLSNQSKVASMTEAAYRQAYGGAAVGYRSYGNRNLQQIVSVIGVRAASPGLTNGPVLDPAYLGLAVNQYRVVNAGAVSCLVYDSNLVAAGAPVNPSNDVYERCQRTGPGLTVLSFGNLSGVSGGLTMVALTNQAWTAASRS